MPEKAEELPVDLSVSKIIEALEYTLDAYGSDGWSHVGGASPATYSGGPSGRIHSQSSLADREDGRYRPFDQTQWGLARQRAMSRHLAAFTSVSVGALQALQVYVMGGEWDYEVRHKEESGLNVPMGLIEAVQRCVNDFLDRNEWVGDFDRELHDASREDGEALVGLYPAAGGEVDARRIEPDSLREPANKRPLDDWLMPAGVRAGSVSPFDASSWTFGVHTVYDERMKRIDHTRHAGYHVVHDDAGAHWEYLPSTPQPHLGSKCAVLMRRNVIRTAKRGVSDFWPVQVDLEREDKLSENMSVGAAVQSAIAYIRQHPKGTTSSDASSTINDALDTFSRAIKANRGSERSIERSRAGTVVDVPAGKEYKPSPFAGAASSYLEVAGALKRRIGIRWLFPEYMISGDASNANFSSTLVAESPFVKAREGDQQQYAKAFKRIIWRVVKIAHDSGRFRNMVRSWSELNSYLELAVTPPPVATRDKAQLAAELTALWDRGIVDSNTVLRETRRNEREELEGVTGGAVAGGISPPGTRTGDSQSAAISAALESVRTTSEARAVLDCFERY